VKDHYEDCETPLVSVRAAKFLKVCVRLVCPRKILYHRVCYCDDVNMYAYTFPLLLNSAISETNSNNYY
jgi:hypothetical protein